MADFCLWWSILKQISSMDIDGYLQVTSSQLKHKTTQDKPSGVNKCQMKMKSTIMISDRIISLSKNVQIKTIKTIS